MSPDPGPGPTTWAGAYPPQPLHDYALIADGERGAVLGPRGEIAWLCAPRWDSEPVFGSLLGAGSWAVTPIGDRYVWGGYYEDGTLIWRNRWVTNGGLVECREALARPGDRDTVVVLRRVIGQDGDCRIRVVLDPRMGGRDRGLRDLRLHDRTWEARLGELHVRVSGLCGAHVDDDGALVAELYVAAGAQVDLVLEVSTAAPTAPPVDPVAAWRSTERAWRADVPEVEGVWARRDVRQAYAVLAGMTSSAGGMVAAATRSLPERAERGRDYDYRFAWLRDQAMVGQAMAALGPHRLMSSAVDFVSERLLEHGVGVRPAYTVEGSVIPDERRTGLPGYPGGVDHRGNGAGDQFQLDVFGEALHLFAAAARHGALAKQTWRAAEAAVAAIETAWQCPDAGIWELDRREWTHSRLVLVSGLQRIAALAPAGQSDSWLGLARRIDEHLRRRCLHPDGRWQRAADDPGVDAALLIPVVRMPTDPATDPTSRRTVAAVLADLTEEEFCYRFRDEDADGLEDAEGAFVFAGFQMAMALERLGDHTLAARWFERNRAACGAPGLFTEEYDVVQRQQRGNLPQAFVHGALIEASALLSR